MAICAQTFAGIDTARFLAIAEKVRSKTGVAVAGAEGQASANGFTLAWKYSPESQQLTVECLKKPFFVSGGLVLRNVQQLVEETCPDSSK